MNKRIISLLLAITMIVGGMTVVSAETDKKADEQIGIIEELPEEVAEDNDKLFEDENVIGNEEETSEDFEETTEEVEEVTGEAKTVEEKGEGAEDATNTEEVEGDDELPTLEDAEMEQIYPILISYMGETTVDYISMETLDKVYKVIGDNIDKTYLSLGQENIISFDDQSNFALTDELMKELKPIFEEDFENMGKLLKEVSKDTKVQEGSINNKNLFIILTAVQVAMLFVLIMVKSNLKQVEHKLKDLEDVLDRIEVKVEDIKKEEK